MIFFTPLEQFELISKSPLAENYNVLFMPIRMINYCLAMLGNNNISYTFSVIYIFFLIVVIMFFKKIKFIPRSTNQIIFENIVVVLKNFIEANATLANQPHLILFVSITISLTIYNVIGMIPFGFTVTAHILLTFFFSFTLFFGINYIAIVKHGIKFLNIFLPSGTPIVLIPFLVLIEFISYFSRLFSLAIRLFANMMSGHTLLKIFSTFSYYGFISGGISFFFSFFAVVLLIPIIIMEFCIALLQVFVFITLISLYILDVHSVYHH
jgi:F-type H+-transporting ATPase subunit a